MKEIKILYNAIKHRINDKGVTNGMLSFFFAFKRLKPLKPLTF